MLEKALKTNGCNLSDLAVPNWNINKLKKDIALLEKEKSDISKQVEFLRHKAFGITPIKYGFVMVRTKYSTESGVLTSGVDYETELKPKLLAIDAIDITISEINEMLKSLELQKNG